MKLPVRRAHQLELRPEQQRWLIEHLWTDEAVGIVGGAPKCCKSFCALDMAVSVASGAPCLGRFRPAQTGRVLLFAGEDPLSVVRERLEGISLVAGRNLDELDLLVITAPKLRLDVDDDRTRLSNTIEALSPKLLVLDPFVRLHSCDENAVAEVAPLLDYLRALQRNYHCSVLLVHHARKNAGSLRGGQALRGSSELFAWTDSNLSLRRKGEELLLGAEHRSAPGLEELPVELCDGQGGMALRVVDTAQPSERRRHPLAACGRADPRSTEPSGPCHDGAPITRPVPGTHGAHLRGTDPPQRRGDHHPRRRRIPKPQQRYRYRALDKGRVAVAGIDSHESSNSSPSHRRRARGAWSSRSRRPGLRRARSHARAAVRRLPRLRRLRRSPRALVADSSPPRAEIQLLRDRSPRRQALDHRRLRCHPPREVADHGTEPSITVTRVPSNSLRALTDLQARPTRLLSRRAVSRRL